ncbi:alpha/beta fold hydrolase [Flavobacterium caeni]|uniref:Pimeloyl-ACP methyl ester carboxylesterase n=1 Tax=Flavobacterium caeni TaxID=490189 RepID=A0A1G5FQ34_9FLAO|nr:alpha/beta hydrolase [Flavobacterium caeni]SCY41346.1 Pimeloyl-ACP methyl ester carboxylesterase [Flavobacterium caeni]
MQLVKGKGIVLIHGAGLGAFIWQDMKLDWQVLRINFQNRGNGPANTGLHYKDYVEEVVQQIDNWTVDQIVIVGHSIGGCIALNIAARYPGRVIGFIGIAAAIPAKGGSFVSCLPPMKRLLLPLVMRIFGTKPPAATIKNGLCKGLDDEQTAKIVSRFTFESRELYLEDCEGKIPKIPRMYILTTDDREMPAETQRQMAKNLKTKDISKIDSGHLPMLQEPFKLSHLINDFCKKLDTQKRE